MDAAHPSLRSEQALSLQALIFTRVSGSTLGVELHHYLIMQASNKTGFSFVQVRF